jgi:hypothetical protein
MSSIRCSTAWEVSKTLVCCPQTFSHQFTSSAACDFVLLNPLCCPGCLNLHNSVLPPLHGHSSAGNAMIQETPAFFLRHAKLDTSQGRAWSSMGGRFVARRGLRSILLDVFWLCQIYCETRTRDAGAARKPSSLNCHELDIVRDTAKMSSMHQINKQKMKRKAVDVHLHSAS